MKNQNETVCGAGRGVGRGFTLIELLVVVAILALIMAILLPSLARAREQAKATKCLANLSGMGKAHWMYMTEMNQLIQAGLGHGGSHFNEPVAWINTLSAYYGKALLHRCPSDESVHWPASELPGSNVPITGSSPPVYRRTSYGINDYLDPDLYTENGGYRTLSQVPGPSRTIMFVEMAETGEYAGADHIHAGLFFSPNPNGPPVQGAKQLEIHQHGGSARTWKARSNFVFLDGHAETLRFDEVYRNATVNMFDPAATPP